MRDRDELRALRRQASTTSATATALDEASDHILVVLLLLLYDTELHIYMYILN
jgi:hypothetical protein